jgi:APA family basic amino acid/polyamine antiporter
MGQFRAADLFRRKPVGRVVAEGGEHLPEEGLHRTIGLFQLTMLGVGATIGTGIFVALTTAVPAAGPAVIVSFVIAGITAALTALCYAELASTIPVSGSSYSYAYATLGEFVAFLVGACLLLEYAVSASAIAVGWGQYLNEMFSDLIGWRMPDAIAKAPGAGGVFNLPAVVLVGACLILLLRGVKESVTVNAVLVVLKLLVLLFFVVIAFSGFHAENLKPFAPMGMAGIGAAASSIFFSYIGIDAVSTAGDEVKDPRRTLPLGIILSPADRHGVYILVALAAVGAQPWTAFAGQEAGLAVILRNLTGQAWTSLILCVGAIVSIFSITLVVMYGQTRILYAMSRDGLLPKLFQRVNPKDPEPGPQHLDRRGLHRPAGRLRAARHPGQPDQHGHADRLRHRLAGGDHPAADPAGPAARLPRAAVSGRAAAQRGLLRLPDHRPAAGHLDPVRGLGGGGVRDLFRLLGRKSKLAG